MRIKGLVITLVLLVAALWGCAGLDLYPDLSRRLQMGDCQGAVALINANATSYGSNSQLLYLLDSAMVGLQCRQFDLVQERLHAAERLADQLWTESISLNAASFLTNDNTLPYSGEDYERVLIHLTSAIGYLQTGQLDEALVEVRRLDSLLAVFGEKYSDAQVYRSDAFGRYLSGILHEADGGLDDAFIDYLKAVRIYQNEWMRYGVGVPACLAEDLRFMGGLVGRLAEAQEALGQTADSLPTPESGVGPRGKVVLILFSGQGPHKVEQRMIVPTLNGPISIAIPQIEAGPASFEGGTLLLAGDQGTSQATALALVSDINQIALKALEDRQGSIVAKALARAVAKQVVIKGVANSQKEKNNQHAMEAILNVANTLFLERADIRCWRTLPGRIWMARVWAAPGRYQARVLCGHSMHELGDVEVLDGQTRFLFLDTHLGPGSALASQ